MINNKEGNIHVDFLGKEKQQLFDLMAWHPNSEMLEHMDPKDYFEYRVRLRNANKELIRILQQEDQRHRRPKSPTFFLERLLSRTEGVIECVFSDVLDPDGQRVTYDIITGGPQEKATLIIMNSKFFDLVGLYTATETILVRTPNTASFQFYEGWENKPMDIDMLGKLESHVNNLKAIAGS
jgi:hypothetical protein